jgi:outer membrane protein OmpA-like peptidoglycan-associated protein
MTDITVEATNEGVMITLSNIMFEADSAALPRSEMAKIYEIAGILRAIPGIKILIAGHTTNIGAEDYLRALSRDRAQSVADYLIFLETFEAANITIVGYGGGRPIGDNSTAAGMAANRRVELIILE